jgi:uncharacterized membrane protein
MKFESSVDINAPIDKVVALFNNPENFKEWQTGFVGYEPISGTPRTAGAKSKVVYNYGKRKMELIETIQVMNLPAEMTALYEHEHMVNTMINSFTELPGNKTRYTAGIGYAKFIGFLPKLMAWLMPDMAKKQNQKWLDQFKAFAEKQ